MLCAVAIQQPFFFLYQLTKNPSPIKRIHFSWLVKSWKASQQLQKLQQCKEAEAPTTVWGPILSLLGGWILQILDPRSDSTQAGGLWASPTPALQ